MITRGLLAAGAAIAFAFLAQPHAAQAQDIDIGIGVGPQYDPGYRRDYDPGYRRDYDRDEDFISCSQGRRIVRRAGYNSVSSLRCSGDVYRYRGIRRGSAWRISVDASSGAIVGTRKIGSIE
jgi:hypothetical protein